jgi:hypothetical protein
MKQPAKKLTLAILALAFLVGLVGCFLKFFDMAKYKAFLEAFQPFYYLMVISVGGGAIADRLKEKNRDDQKSV